MSDPRQPSGLSRFVAEMRRRHVVRFALGYAAAAFVLLQLAEIVFPAFAVGETGLRILVVAVALLFPPAVVVAWVYDVTAEGIKRTESLDDGGRRTEGRLPQVALLGVTVVTLAGVGLWMARVGLIGELVAPPTSAATSQPVDLVAYDPTAPIRSLAVLPLENFSGTGEQDYFTAGMLEELIAQLSQIAGLRVVSRTSVMRYAGAATPIPQIGRDLRVDGVIEGSVRREGDRVRITVQLIHAASDTHVWTQQYDRSLSDVLALQSEVALDIAEQLRAELSPKESTLLNRTASREVAPAAQDAYLRGRYELDKGTPEGYEAAMHLFEQALSADADFAPAMAGLASARFVLNMAAPEPSSEELDLAEEEARTALEMDSLSVEAQEVFTLIRSVAPKAGDVPPTPGVPPTSGVPRVVVVPGTAGLSDTAWATAMTQLGRHIEQQVRVKMGHAERAGRAGMTFAARQLLSAGRFEEAASLASEVVREDASSATAWETLVRARVAGGNLEAAVRAVDAWSESGGSGAPSAADAAALRNAVSDEGARGFWRWTVGRQAAAIEAGRPVPASERAAALVGIGEHDRAFAALEEAIARHDPGLSATLRVDPVWDPLRADARFASLVRRARALAEDPRLRGRPR
jgi:TolB-like protein